MNLAELKALAKAAEHYARITSSRSEVVDFYSCIIPDGIVELIANYEKAVEALKKIASEDFRGNRPQSAVDAYKTLKDLGEL